MAMRLVKFHIEGQSGVSFSRLHETPKEKNEKPALYEQRTWREKAHYDPDSLEVYIPQMAFKFALEGAMRRTGLRVKDKGAQTYAKRIAAGVIPGGPAFVGVKRDDVRCERVLCNVKGMRGGSGAHVIKLFPMVPPGWKAAVELFIVDDEIPNEMIELAMEQAGAFVGVGRFRPEKGGFLGRFVVNKTEWAVVTR